MADKTETLDRLIQGFERGDRVALARLITKVENRSPEVSALMERIYSRTGRAHIIGVTGAPGAGKSTLITRLVSRLRAMGKRVAVVAIDPSSPFSGGAVLGDRVRMSDHYKDSGVYIRSLSTRGSHGGLSRAAREIIKLLDAFGHDYIILETVGVGQTELAVMNVAHTTVVVTVPEGGDGIQVMKAGLNEIADVFVVNKSDRDGADRVKAELEMNVHLRAAAGWHVPVLLTQAVNDKGIEELVTQLDRHFQHLQTNKDPKLEHERRLREFREVLAAELEERATRALSEDGEFVTDLLKGNLNPYSAARRLIQDEAAMKKLLQDQAGTKR